MKRERTDYIVLCSSETTPDQEIGLTELDDRDRTKGYFMCCYHVVVKRCGTIEQGYRGLRDHAMGLKHHNPVSVAICVVGGKGEPRVTNAQLYSLVPLLNELREEWPDAKIVDHHDLDRNAPKHKIAHYFNNPEGTSDDACPN